MQTPIQYAKRSMTRTLRSLEELVRIPSVSFPGFDWKHVDRSGDCTLRLLKDCGLQNCRLLRLGKTHPYVYGEWLHAGKDKPTVLLYAHHDVQPPMRQELWKSPAFVPTTRGGRMFGRGTADDKAGVLLHTASVEAYLKTQGALPVNIKVIIEGEEEIGSPNLEVFLKRYKKLLRSDVIVLADAQNYDTGIPTLTTSLRGLMVMEVECAALDHPLHSGLWSGPIPDPIQGLAKAIASLTRDDGTIAIPGFYDDVAPLSAVERKHLRRLGMSPALFRKQSMMLDGVQFWQSKRSLLENQWRQPSLIVNSFVAGDRKTAGNVILDKAWARIGIRLAPGQDPRRAVNRFTKHMAKQARWGLKLRCKTLTATTPWRTETSHPVFDVASKALAKGYGKPTAFIGCGASIPFVESFGAVFGNIPTLLVGVEDPYTNAHGENESLHLGDFQKAIAGQIEMFAALGEWKR